MRTDAETETAASSALVARDRAWTLVFFLTTLASAIPILATRYLPITDVPEHVAAIATMQRLIHGQDAHYDLALGTSQYLLYDLVGAMIKDVTGDAVLANQLLLAAVAAGWALSFRGLLRALGRDERVAIFATMVFWNRAVVIGFLPFVAGVPLAIFGIALTVRQCAEPKKKRAGALLLLATALFYAHVSAWTLFVGIAVVIVAVSTLPRFPLRRLTLTLGPVLPGVVLAALWWRSGSLADGAGHEAVHRQAFAETLGAVPLWTFDIWRTHIDELCAIGWWLAFSVVLLKAARPERSMSRVGRRYMLLVFAPFGCAAFVYLATPFGIGKTAYLNVRLAPLLALFSLLWLRPRRDAWGAIPLGGAAAMALVTAGNGIYEMRRASHEMLGDFDSVLAQIRPGARVLTLDFERRSPRLHYYPYIYAGSYSRMESEGIAFYSFTELTHWPIHYAVGQKPPSAFGPASSISAGAWPAFIPCAYRYRRDGNYYDNVLVQGRFNPFADTPLGPTFRKVATSGNFTLYEKSGVGSDDGTGPDRGPCS